MKVDCHFHLEEGPYSVQWMKRTAQALESLERDSECVQDDRHSLRWIGGMHTKLARRMEQGCFSSEWLGCYLERGMKLGIERFGIVDHLYRFEEFRAYYEQHITLDDSLLGRKQRCWLDRVCIGSIEPYLKLVSEAKQAGHPISLGVEADYFPGGEEELGMLLSSYDLDYVIGSVHFIDGWGFDNPECQGKFEEHDLTLLYRKLFDYVLGAIRCGLFDMIAHLDNLKVFNYRPDEALLVPMYEEVAKALKAANLATEINTGLAYRHPVQEMCPSPAFLKVIYDHGVPITLSSDSHFPDDIGMMLDEAEALARRTGYQEIIYYEGRQRRMMKLESALDKAYIRGE